MRYFVLIWGFKSDQLTQSAYMCEWTDASKEFKQNLIIFMTRTQFPLKLYASGYFTLSLETFKAVSSMDALFSFSTCELVAFSRFRLQNLLGPTLLYSIKFTKTKWLNVTN